MHDSVSDHPGRAQLERPSSIYGSSKMLRTVVNPRPLAGNEELSNGHRSKLISSRCGPDIDLVSTDK